MGGGFEHFALDERRVVDGDDAEDGVGMLGSEHPRVAGTERVADDDGRAQTQRLLKCADVPAEIGGLVPGRRLVAASVTALVDRDCERGPGEGLDDGLPDREIGGCAVQEDHRRALRVAADLVGQVDGEPRRAAHIGVGEGGHTGSLTASVRRAATSPRTIAARFSSTSPLRYSYIPPPDFMPSLPSAVSRVITSGTPAELSSWALR